MVTPSKCCHLTATNAFSSPEPDVTVAYKFYETRRGVTSKFQCACCLCVRLKIIQPKAQAHALLKSESAEGLSKVRAAVA